jgi:5-methyltetrahydrofolate--homocysteine methyltransferase
VSCLRDWLAGGLLVTDGAWGTQLQARGLTPGVLPDTWNLSHPDCVEGVARAYVEAGSQVILTNTFRANTIAMDEDVEAINRSGVEVSKRAAGGRALVFAAIGPTGKILIAGQVSEEQAIAAFAEQAAALATAGADALLVETMSDIAEARLAVAAAKGTGLPVIASFAFDTGKNKDRTMMGFTPRRLPLR